MAVYKTNEYVSYELDACIERQLAETLCAQKKAHLYYFRCAFAAADFCLFCGCFCAEAEGRYSGQKNALSEREAAERFLRFLIV